MLPSLAAIALVLVVPPPVAGQAEIPTISGTYFTSGSAMEKVSGSVQIDQEVPINAKASFGDGR